MSAKLELAASPLISLSGAEMLNFTTPVSVRIECETLAAAAEKAIAEARVVTPLQTSWSNEYSDLQTFWACWCLGITRLFVSVLVEAHIVLMVRCKVGVETQNTRTKC